MPDPHPIPPRSATTTPTCWKCGYHLTGLGVDDVCPECATPVWSHKDPAADYPELASKATSAMVWGIVALVTFFACLGPLAGLVAIPAIIKGNQVRAVARAGSLPSSIAGNAKAGLICGWIAAGLSIAILVFYAVLVLAVGF